MASFTDRFRHCAARPLVATTWLAAGIALSACSQPDAAEVAVAPASGPSVGVTAAVLRSVRAFDTFSGRLEATESVELRPRVGGHIAKVHVRAGQHVTRGQLLFSIDPAKYEAAVARAQAQVDTASAQAELAGTELARGRGLFAQRAISQQEFEQLSAASRVGQSQLASARAALASAALDLGYCRITAPISGRIAASTVTEGNFVRAGDTVLTRIAAQEHMLAYFDASEEAYLRLRPHVEAAVQAGARAGVAIEMGLLGETGFPHKGVIQAFDNRLDAQTGAMRVRAVFDNRRRQFTPGLYARLRLSAGPPIDAVLAPERAVGTDQSRKYLVVIGPDDKAQWRDVTLGPQMDGMRVIASGLRAGERVVVDGLQRVRPGTLVTPQTLVLDADGRPMAP